MKKNNLKPDYYRPQEKLGKNPGNSPKFILQDVLLWLLVLFISFFCLFLGHHLVTHHLDILRPQHPMAKAMVVEVLETDKKEAVASEMAGETKIINFRAKLLESGMEGQIIESKQYLDPMFIGSNFIKIVEKGDKVYLSSPKEMGSTGDMDWHFTDYYRLDKIFVLLAVFALLLLVIGRIKGLSTLVSLAFTFGFVFFVFVPAVMSGRNIYVWAVITCIYVISMTLLLIHGFSQKTLVTLLSCVLGTLLAAAISFYMKKSLALTGMIDEDATYLLLLNKENPLDLTAIIFSTIIIGAMGAIMDVAMDISASLHELHKNAPNLSMRDMAYSGMNIGCDVVGTMANTLVLAYIGSSLAGIILLIASSNSLTHLLNREVLIVEMLQAVVGSLAILLTMPISVLMSCLIYHHWPKRRKA